MSKKQLKKQAKIAKQKQSAAGNTKSGGPEGASDDEDEEEMDDEEPVDEGADPMTSRAAFKKLVIATLESEELLTKRAAKMEILDFLTLLNAMNNAGIHFK